MKMTRQVLLVAAVSALLGACSRSQSPETPPANARQTPGAETQTLKLAGKVVDAAGNPLAGATVEYWHAAATTSSASDLELEKQITTVADGAYEIETSGGFGFVLAHKAGLAPAWKMLMPSLPAAAGGQQLVLTPPGALTGAVLDESNQPVANAEVSVGGAFGEMQVIGDNARAANYIIGKPARDLFTARTDATGRFRIENFPTNASALFKVKVSGKVLRQETIAAGSEMPGYRVGDAGIKLILEPAGSIEGKIVCGESNQPSPIARLALQSDQPTYFARFGLELVKSSADGAFRIPDVADGSYHIRAMFGTNADSEWVAEPVAVSVEAGKVTRDVQITAQRGALLEVTVLGKENRKPMAQVNVTAYRENSQANGLSDNHGIVRLHLLPGDYLIYAIRQSASAVSSQTSATVEAGQTNRVEFEIAALKKIAGVVRGPDGKPEAGIAVQLVGGYGLNRGELKTDAGGKFELEWNEQSFAGQSDSTACVLVRDPEHNLAVAQDLDEDTTHLDLRLAPGLTLAGRAECDGKPLTNATAALVFWTGRTGQWLQGLTRTNTPTPGQFEIPALPPGRKYGLIVSAPGYGQKQLFNFDVSADAGHQELDPVELKPANLQLAGQVLDADDNPISGAVVSSSGEGQPNVSARTDRNGRFTFEHVCEGALQLSANYQSAYGSASAEGGDTNVVLRLGQTYSSSSGATMHKLKGTVTNAGGKPAAGAQVAVFPNNGTRGVKTGANGEYNLTWSLQSWQMQNGGAVLVVRDPARNLAATEGLSEDDTNLDVKLKPALAFSGQVKNADGAPLSSAKITFWIKAGNSYDFLDQAAAMPVNAEGRFEIKCLPADGQYMIAASAKGFGRHEQQPLAGLRIKPCGTGTLRSQSRRPRHCRTGARMTTTSRFPA